MEGSDADKYLIEIFIEHCTELQGERDERQEYVIDKIGGVPASLPLRGYCEHETWSKASGLETRL